MALKFGEIKTTGFKEADMLLKRLPEAVRTRVLVAAQRKVAKPTIKDMKQNLKSQGVEDRSGRLQKAIGSTVVSKTPVEATTFFGVRRGKRYSGYHAHLIEGGTEERKPKKGRFLVFKNKAGETIVVTKAKAMRPRPFVDPAIEANKMRMQNEYPKEIAESLNRLMKRYIRKAKK